MEFRVGDRVNVYAYGYDQIVDEPLKGTMIDSHCYKDNTLLRISFDKDNKYPHFHCVFAKQCRKLVKKRKFKVGDRVVIKGGSESLIGKKGTIVYVTRCGEYAELVIDDHRTKVEAISIKSLNLYTKNLKKLIKKKTELKVGDRISWVSNSSNERHKGMIVALENVSGIDNRIMVKFDKLDFISFCKKDDLKKLRKKKVNFAVGDRVSCETLGDRLKGNVEAISADENVINVKVDNLRHIAICRPNHLKKLVKKKKVDEKPNIRDKVKELHELGRRWERASDLLKMAKEFCSKKKESKEPKLLPCPFCGSDHCHVSSYYAIKRIICPECGIYTGKYCDEELAINHWNRRSYP